MFEIFPAAPTQGKKQAMNVQIRWMIRRDMPDVLKIENESFEFIWTEEDFLACLRQRNCVGMVAENSSESMPTHQAIAAEATKVWQSRGGGISTPWQQQRDWDQALRNLTTRYNSIKGFMIYELHKTRLHILNFAVAPGFRRLAVGTQMIEKLINKLSQQRRQEIVLEVRETNLVAQLFYHNQGFRATGVLRNHYHDSAEDAYVMQYRLDGECVTLPMWRGTNRIADKWYDLNAG